MSAMTENADEKKSIREALKWKLQGVRDIFDARPRMVEWTFDLSFAYFIQIIFDMSSSWLFHEF